MSIPIGLPSSLPTDRSKPRQSSSVTSLDTRGVIRNSSMQFYHFKMHTSRQNCRQQTRGFDGSTLPTGLSSGSLTKALFWEIIDNASTTTDPAGRLSELLNELASKNIAAFNRHFEAAMDRAYRWDLWAAAYLLLGG